jgi:hypothetical protein
MKGTFIKEDPVPSTAAAAEGTGVLRTAG